MHEATQNDALHNAAPELIANPAGNDAAHYLKAVIKADGSYTVTNGRNAFSRSYASR